jgi:hypothetical protein
MFSFHPGPLIPHKKTNPLTRFALLFFLAFTSHGLSAQSYTALQAGEDSLKRICAVIKTTTGDSNLLVLNGHLQRTLDSLLALEGSFEYPFDSLGIPGKIESPDHAFRIFNWDIRLSDGRYRYYGLLQWNPQFHSGWKPVILLDGSDSIHEAGTAVLDASRWLGTLYYRIIPGETDGRKIYTLLGWKGLDPLVNARVIEVLSFHDRGIPVFGMDIFSGMKDQHQTRVIFRYSSGTSMTLTYDEQFYETGKKWDVSSGQWVSKKQREWMIVCDRLVPMDPALEGQFQFYVPASDVYDGFVFDHGRWVLMSDIDARNH